MKLNRLQKILMAVIGVVVCFSLTLGVMQISSSTPFSYDGFNLINMMRYTLFNNPIQSMKETMDIISHTWSLEQENEVLRQQVEGIASLQAKVKEQENQINELQALNDLKSILSDYVLYPTTVFSRSYETWNNFLTIDIGSNDGINENYAVVSPKGLVGRIEHVGETSATVNLLTVSDGTNKVSVKILISEGVEADAILERYNHQEQAFVVKLLDSNNTVTEGMSVITSGMGGVFPSGLLVGEITRVDELDNAIGMDILVKPAADFQSLNYLYVVKRVDE